jgi:DNA-binding MarR family transcriptional regulator
MNKASKLSVSFDPDSPDVCYCLAGRRSARFLTRLYESHLAPLGMTMSQFSILSLLERYPGITVVDLAGRMEMERTTLLRTVKPLKEQGLVVEGSEKQGRAVLLFMSESGLRMLVQARPYWEAAQREFEEKVGAIAAARFRKMAMLAAAHEE